MSTSRRHPEAICEECPLFEENTFVPSFIPDEAEMVIVGEAPGATEVKTGKPFTGTSGELLNILLKHAGIKRSEVMITNVCLCRPEGNKNPPREAVRACAPRLESEIQSRSPKYIVALGNFAQQAILGTSEGITKVRVGPPKSVDKYPNSQVVATYHPAAALYNPDVFPDIVTDFGKLNADYKLDTKWSEPEFTSFDNPDTARHALHALLEDSSLREVAIDIEVGIEKDTDFGHPDRYSLLCVGLSYRVGGCIVIGERACNDVGVRYLLGRVLLEKEIIAQNGKFDLQGLRDLAPLEDTSLAFDTMLAHYCLDERRGTHSLDQLAVEYLGSPDWKSEIKRYLGSSKNYADIPRDVLYRYNAYDVANTFHLAQVFKPMLRSAGLERTHQFLLRSSKTLMLMESAGVAVDEEYLDVVEEDYLGRLALLEERLGKWVKNPRSPKQVKEALIELGLKRVGTTNAEALEKYRDRALINNDEQLYSFTYNMLEYRKEHKLYGTYIKGIRQRIYNGRVHPTFLLHGTVTGRLSSRNPNLQNIPRGSVARRLFIPSTPDHVLIQADYRQAELRVVCGLARDAYLRDVFSDEGRDIHGEVAERFYGPNWTKEQRVRAKAVVFGLTYGREAFSLAAEHGMSVAEAEKYISTFFNLIPDTVKWIENLEKQVLEGEDLVSPFGRRRRFHIITNHNKHNVLKEARAFLPQSTASDLTLESGNRLVKAGYGKHLRIPVHDALILEVPQKEAAQVTAEVKRIMEEVGHELFEGYVKFPVDIGMGPSWAELE